MSSVHYSFDQEKLKPILTAFINSNFDFNSMPIPIIKPFKAIVQDNVPYIWISDGFYFIEGIFTKDAINDFRKHYSNMKLYSLRDKIIYITKWSLQVRQVDSRSCLTSYQNLTFQLVIDHFKPILHETVMNRAKNKETVFKDMQIQSLIRNARHSIIQQQLGKHFYYHMSEFSLPSLKDVLDTKYEFKEVKNQDELDLQEEFSTDQDQKMSQSLQEATKQFNDELLTEISTQLTQNEVLRCQTFNVSKDLLVKDNKDFEIFEEMFNKQDDQDFDNNNFYDIKRIFIQERGEDAFETIYNSKMKQMQDKLDDEYTRQELSMKLEYYNKDQGREEFKRQIQEKISHLRQIKAKPKKIITYKLGITEPEIKSKMLRFLTTFNPDIQLEQKANQIDTRPRSFSQENIRVEQSEMMETKTERSHAFPLSQYVCQQSEFNDETESEREDDEEDEQVLAAKAYRKEQLNQITPTISVYKRYLEWFKEHEVTTQSKYAQIQEAIRLQKEQEEKERLQLEEIARVMREKEEQERIQREKEEEKIIDIDYLMVDEEPEVVKKDDQPSKYEEDEMIGKKSQKKTYQNQGFVQLKKRRRYLDDDDIESEKDESESERMESEKEEEQVPQKQTKPQPQKISSINSSQNKQVINESPTPVKIVDKKEEITLQKQDDDAKDQQKPQQKPKAANLSLKRMEILQSFDKNQLKLLKALLNQQNLSDEDEEDEQEQSLEKPVVKEENDDNEQLQKLVSEVSYFTKLSKPNKRQRTK